MADGWNMLGILLDKSKQRSDALVAFSHALEVDPDHADALFNRAKIELLESKLPEARRDVDRLRKAHSDYASGLLLDAHLCEAEKNTAGAKAALTEFLALPKLDPRMKAMAEDMLKKLGS
jgi:tetratricopeptide (TPR) repeat protein